MLEYKANSAHLGYGRASPILGRDGQIVFLQDEGNARRILTMRFAETRKDIGEVSLRNAVALATVGPNAVDAATPMLNVPFGVEILHWVLWREGQTVFALVNTETTPCRVTLPEEPSCLVMSPLQPRGEGVEALALAQDGLSLQLLRFQEEEPEGQLVWTAPLPVRPQSIVAALAPEQAREERHLAFVVAQESGSVDIFHSRYTRNGALKPFRSVTVEAAWLIPDTSPALFVDGDGTAHITLAFLQGKESRRCGLAEATFPPSGDPGSPQTLTLGELPGLPLHGALLYVDSRNRIARREAVFLAEDGDLYKWNIEQDLIRARSQGTPILPLLLVPGKEFTYLLFREDHGGLSLQMI